jgi:hypothetical protein
VALTALEFFTSCLENIWKKNLKRPTQGTSLQKVSFLGFVDSEKKLPRCCSFLEKDLKRNLDARRICVQETLGQRSIYS